MIQPLDALEVSFANLYPPRRKLDVDLRTYGFKWLYLKYPSNFVR